MIRVSNLTKDYGNRRAISDLSFNIERGEIVGFLGPNGAGKTTTMRIMTGYMPPTSGTVEIKGFDIIDQSLEARKVIGYLPETVPLYADMTVFDYLMYMAHLRHLNSNWSSLKTGRLDTFPACQKVCANGLVLLRL
jgi:ABC-2 type transport system ATP-binding protein